MLLAVLLIVVGSSAVVAEDAPPNLDQAYDQSLAISAEREGVAGAQDSSTAARVKTWAPDLSLSGSAGPTFTDARGDQFTGKGNIGVHANTQANKAGMALTLNQNLYQGGAGIANIEKSEHGISLSEALLQEAEQNAILEAISAHTDVLMNRVLVRNAKRNVEFYTRMAEIATAKFELGEDAVVAMEAAKAELESAIGGLATAQMELTNAESRYVRAYGVSPIEKLAPLAAAPLPSLEEAVSVAVKRNPGLMKILYESKVAASDVDIAYGGLLPKVDVQASVSRTLNSHIGGVYNPSTYERTRTNQAAILAQVSIPLNVFGGAQADVRAQRHNAAKKRLQVKNAIREVTELLTDSRAKLTSLNANIKQYKALITSTTIALDAVQERYIMGEDGYLNVIEAESKYIGAVDGLAKAQKNYLMESYKFLSLMGTLVEVSLGHKSAPVEGDHAVWDTAIGFKDATDDKVLDEFAKRRNETSAQKKKG